MFDEEDEHIFKVEESNTPYNIKHRAFYLAKDIISFIASTKYERIYFSMFEQLVRCASSIGANLVEGVAGSSKKDFINFNVIALKSANETKYWLCLIRDTISNIDKKQIEQLLKETNEVSNIIATIVINSKK